MRIDPAVIEARVAGDWQGMGLARTLLERLAEHATASGIGRMAGDALSTDEATIAFAKRMGFAAMQKREDGLLVHLVKDLLPHDRRPSVSRQPCEECVIAA